jgi:hypothetical protein
MTESDITFQLSEIYDRWWVIHQWWVSVSFGLIAVAYFAGQKLNYLLIGVILSLYVAFSVWIHGLVEYQEQIVGGFLSDLRALIESGQIESDGASAYLGAFANVYWPTFGSIAKFGTFICVIGYVGATAFQDKENLAKSSE